jgi:hypothetical protein
MRKANEYKANVLKRHEKKYKMLSQSYRKKYVRPRKVAGKMFNFGLIDVSKMRAK